MTAVKTQTVTFRIAPDVKAALRDAAAQEHRSLANMLEVMSRDYRQRHAIAKPEPRAPSAETRRV